MSDDAKIDVKGDGPYVVSGSVHLRTREPVVSADGEPLDWKIGDVTDEGPAYALCRCGGSANKPYCDGTHANNGFDGTETVGADTYESRRKSIGGTGLEIFDDRGTCVHAGFCGNKATNVWKMAADTGDDAVRAEAIAMVQRCPSGALTLEVDGEAVEPDLGQEISVIPDGPLFVTGSIAVNRSDGTAIDARNRVTLCRCGDSKTKPLCDGTHKETGFKG